MPQVVRAPNGIQGKAGKILNRPRTRRKVRLQPTTTSAGRVGQPHLEPACLEQSERRAPEPCELDDGRDTYDYLSTIAGGTESFCASVERMIAPAMARRAQSRARRPPQSTLSSSSPASLSSNLITARPDHEHSNGGTHQFEQVRVIRRRRLCRRWKASGHPDGRGMALNENLSNRVVSVGAPDLLPISKEVHLHESREVCTADHDGAGGACSAR